jgi:hypothetical protein
MADLPLEWHQIEAPGREPISFFISGDGGARWDQFTILDASSVPCNLTGCSIAAEIRTDDDNLLATLTAQITDPTNGVCRVSSTAAVNAALALPDDAPLNGVRIRLGRYSVFITDSAGRWCIKAGDAYGIRA